MIFNKDGQGAKELRELTANYYANNDFTKVIGEIELLLKNWRSWSVAR